MLNAREIQKLQIYKMYEAEGSLQQFFHLKHMESQF